MSVVRVCGIALLAVTLTVQSIEPLADAVAIWDFAEGSGRVLKDTSGNGHHGQIVEASWVKEDSGPALRFNGKGHYVKVPDSPALHLQPPYTLGINQQPLEHYCPTLLLRMQGF